MVEFCTRNQASKKMLSRQTSVEYQLGHNRKIGDAVDADFERSKGAVRPQKANTSCTEPLMVPFYKNGTFGTHLPAC